MENGNEKYKHIYKCSESIRQNFEKNIKTRCYFKRRQTGVSFLRLKTCDIFDE